MLRSLGQLLGGLVDLLFDLHELPAGLVEPTEQSARGLVHAAQRELSEELGLNVDASAFHELGASVFPLIENWAMSFGPA